MITQSQFAALERRVAALENAKAPESLTNDRTNDRKQTSATDIVVLSNVVHSWAVDAYDHYKEIPLAELGGIRGDLESLVNRFSLALSKNEP